MLEDPRTDPVSFANVMVGLDKAGISDDARLEMYKQRRFGIDWGVGASVSTAASPEDDWETSMDNMYDLCRDGGLRVHSGHKHAENRRWAPWPGTCT